MRIGALLASVCLLSGCTAWGDDDGRDHDPANRPGYTRPDADDGRGGGGRPEHRVRGSGTKGDTATFQLVNGSDVVKVSTGDLGADLYDVSTPDGSRSVPTVDVDGSSVV